MDVIERLGNELILIMAASIIYKVNLMNGAYGYLKPSDSRSTESKLSSMISVTRVYRGSYGIDNDL